MDCFTKASGWRRPQILAEGTQQWTEAVGGLPASWDHLCDLARSLGQSFARTREQNVSSRRKTVFIFKNC